MRDRLLNSCWNLWCSEHCFVGFFFCFLFFPSGEFFTCTQFATNMIDFTGVHPISISFDPWSCLLCWQITAMAAIPDLLCALCLGLWGLLEAFHSVFSSLPDIHRLDGSLKLWRVAEAVALWDPIGRAK